MSIDYKGARWYKCDLHLHTPASKCFQDQTVTAEQWVERAIEQGLNCIAVTDHNTGEMIDEIKLAAQGKELIVFPGVEITCDTSKVHLLILFDKDKGSVEVGDFLVKSNVEREMFGEQNANTVKSIFEILKIAHEVGAIVIPAHVDEYNGLGSASVDILNQFYGDDRINAVQVIHKEFLAPELQRSNYSELVPVLNEYYNNPGIPIDEATIKQWHTAAKYAVINKLAILTFSDNPHEPKNSKHGLAGIGTHYSWIKMDEFPSLEGLRQAFLLPEFRIKNEFDSSGVPYETPSLWIKSISVANTSITEGDQPLKIEFNPQLNTIIGGRGSGKSSILRLIRGLFNHMGDLSDLPDILEDQNEFYKRGDGKTQGVLTESSIIEVEFVRNNVLHKFTGTNLINSKNQTIKIEKFNSTMAIWELIEDEAYSDFFLFEQYSQKQIYEIAQEPNSMRERIDYAIPAIGELKRERDSIKRAFFERSTTIRTIEQQILGKGKLQTEIKDLETSINLLQESGISVSLQSRGKYLSEEENLNKFESALLEKKAIVDEIIITFEIEDIDFSTYDHEHSEELSEFTKTTIDHVIEIKKSLEKVKADLENTIRSFHESIENSKWNNDRGANLSEFESKKEELQLQGINDFGNYEVLTSAKKQKETLLEQLGIFEAALQIDRDSRSALQADYLAKSILISEQRRLFLNELLSDGKIKIIIKPFRNKSDFENKLRKILQREDHFQESIDKITEIYLNGNIEQTIVSVRELFLKIRKGEEVTELNKHFVNLVNSLNDSQIDEIELLLAEDDIEVQYKTSDNGSYKSLSTASAGQKTTAILTYLLSHGNTPLILDQPEDDLDSRHVYDLIVDRLKKAKEYRQIIVVTHNANIPVNGDAEYIISMSTDSEKLKVLHTGTVEQAEIKKEICDVMEGSEEAFDMRYKRYKQI